MEQNQLQATISGTPQGGIISPLLANIAFHGMEDVLGITHHEKGGVKTESEYNLVKYADDFVVFSKSVDTINKAKSLIVTWLKERGLELSEEKTKISNIKEGFDFLGFNIRQYETAYKKRKKVLLIKPSKSSVLSFKKQMTIEWKKMLGEKTENIIHKLNPKIIGWANYFCIGTSKETFSKLDHWMYIRQKRYAERRHLKEGQRCLKNRYWGTIKGRSDQWVFMDKKADRETYMWKLSWTRIRRHIIVKNQASPDNPKYSKYWEVRRKAHIPNLTNTRRTLWKYQKGVCLLCSDSLSNGEELHLHHRVSLKDGGNNEMKNLALLHGNCHRQIHSKMGYEFAKASKLLEPYAG